jgi:hypothetical protein
MRNARTGPRRARGRGLPARCGCGAAQHCVRTRTAGMSPRAHCAAAADAHHRHARRAADPERPGGADQAPVAPERLHRAQGERSRLRLRLHALCSRTCACC